MAKKKDDFVQREFYDKHLSQVPALSGYQDRAWLLFQYHTKRIQAMSMARFKWLGLPKTCNPRFLELELYRKGLCVFYYDRDVNRFFAAKGQAYANLDMFEDPTGFRVYGNSLIPGKSLRPNVDCVPIWANNLRVPDHDLTMIWAARITEFEVTFDINTKNARRPRLLVYDEETRMSAANLNEAIDQGQPTIEMAIDPIQSGMVQAFDLGVDPKMLQELHITRMRLENQMMGELGINNSNQDKKERLVEAEVGANDDQVAVSRAVHLAARKFAALQINDLFPGLNVRVEYGSDVAAEHSSAVDGAQFAPAPIEPEMEGQQK